MNNPVTEIIRSNMPRLTKSEERIARYILNNEAQIGLETGASLAAATQVSEITVSRFLYKLGFRGIRDLKEQLKLTRTETLIESTERVMRLLSGSDSAMIEGESQAIRKLSSQIARPEWQQMATRLSDADRIFVTGFQTVKGMAEDFARRLGVVRDAVRFIAVNEGGLVEWAPPAESIEGLKNLLVLIDIMPYAREAELTCKIARRRGFDVVVFTDEYNNWAYSHTDLVFHAESKTGLFLESTASLNSILNFVVHAVAERNPERARARIDNWMVMTKELDMF
ncbi:MurR/RpiR family transcriptional regulator [Ruegeria marina]|uniref:Transcriptional regulator, RpiR family n=1 Tax=Ruegeria marina TaxID=639004 RepID=A0A1G6VUS8_9RHOB|nr:MurR/RpiR family transcriptional regulator [Ruegeria marina]SDD57173.1 transcriptional regulator, RpiR family [Ruegeria marina]